MPAWHIHFEPTIVYLTSQSKGTHTATVATPGTKVTPPPGSFPVITAVRLNLTDDAQGAAPIALNEKKSASIELIGRAASSPGSPTTPFVSIGVIKGVATFNSKPLFTCSTIKDPSSPNVRLDFSPGTANEVDRSDWVLSIEKHPVTFNTNFVQAFDVRLPWLFNEKTEKLQISTRLTIDNALHADENRNQILDIPLVHSGVPEEADPTKSPRKFLGVRNLYARVNDNNSMPKVSFSGKRIRVILHATFTSFCTSSTKATVPQVVSAVQTIMNDAGFGTSVDVVDGAPADTECAQHWKSVDGRFMSILIKDPDQSKPTQDRLENRFAASITSNSPFSIPSGMEQRIPFFDFYVFAEDNDPPSPTELAHSERLIPVSGSTGGIIANTATKVLATPIIIAKGLGQNTPLRKLLAEIDQADHVNVLAATICHEIGHTFGLKHSVAFKGSLPYQFGDALHARGTMGSGGLVIGSGTPRMPLYFFGPIHQLEIKRLFL